MESVDIKTMLGERNINVSVGDSQATPIYMNKKRLTTMVRASVHYYNTEEEIGTFCNQLKSNINQYANS